MKAELNTHLRQMLESLLSHEPARADYIVNSNSRYYEDDAIHLGEGTGLKALQLLKSKADAGESLNDLEALGAAILQVMATARSADWTPPAPKEVVQVVTTQHTAVIRGTYTIDGSVEAFVRGLAMVLHSKGYASNISHEILEATLLAGGEGLNKVKLKVLVKFTIIRRAVDPVQLESILKGMEAEFKHRQQPLPDIGRSLEDITTITL